MLVLFTSKKISYGLPLGLVTKVVTLNDLERRNGRIR